MLNEPLIPRPIRLCRIGFSLVLVLLLNGCFVATESRCLASAKHTLWQDGQRYVCRRAVSECERGFVQEKHGPEDCEALGECEFVPGQCYCPPQVVCVCGGGPPSRCTVAGDDVSEGV